MDGIILYPVQGALAGDFLAYGRKVFGRYAELACIPRDLTPLTAILLHQREESHEKAGRILIGVCLFHFAGVNVPHIHEQDLEYPSYQFIMEDDASGMDPAPELCEIGLDDVPFISFQRENRMCFDIHISLGSPDLLRVVKVQEWIGNQEEIGIKSILITDVGNERSHLPYDEVSRTGREGLSHGIKAHLSASAKNVAVIVFLIGIRIFPVTKGIEYQKIFHTYEGTED